MKRIFYTLSLIALTLGANAQLLLDEGFNYNAGQLSSASSGANVSGGNWVNFSGTGSLIPVISGSLSYSGYTAAVGNKISIVSNSSSSEDVSRTFTSINTGDVYVSFLLNVTDTIGLADNANANGEYMMAFNPTTYFSRLVVRKGAVGNTYSMGIRHSTSAVTSWSGIDLAINTTQLIIFKYSFIAGTLNDQSSLWVNPVIGGAEPTANATSTNVSTADPANLTSIAIRQGAGSIIVRTPNAEIDGIRVGTAWSSGALPVKWSSFTASKSTDASILRWATASESNNSHFEIQRSADGKNFEAIGKVKGSGNANKTVNYSFTDKDIATSKTTYYRLKQVDFDGKSEFSKTVSVANTIAKAGIGATLPNPFNTDLNITFNAATAATATVVIMDMIGKVHHTETEALQAGANTININTSEMPDGIYFVRVSYNGETFTQKVIKK